MRAQQIIKEAESIAQAIAERKTRAMIYQAELKEDKAREYGMPLTWQGMDFLKWPEYRDSPENLILPYKQVLRKFLADNGTK